MHCQAWAFFELLSRPKRLACLAHKKKRFGAFFRGRAAVAVNSKKTKVYIQAMTSVRPGRQAVGPMFTRTFHAA